MLTIIYSFLIVLESVERVNVEVCQFIDIDAG